MHIALVENAKDHIHRENGKNHQHRKSRDGFLENFCLTLQAPANRGGDGLGRSRLHEFRRLADRGSGHEVEKNRDRRKLVDVVDGLRADNGFPARHGGERNERSGARPHVDFAQIRRA